MAKERIDIEHLLEWAYRTQCVDRQAAAFSPCGPSASVANALGQYAALGTRVDSSGFAARALGLRTPDDALIVHDAVLALGDVWIEWRQGGDAVIWDPARAEEQGWALEDDHGATSLVRRHKKRGIALVRVPLQNAGVCPLVILHARAGSRPDWHEGWRPAERVARRDRRKRIRAERVCDADEVAFDRALYFVWRSALVCLAADLDGALARFDVTGPAALAEPWNRGADTACAIAPARQGDFAHISAADNALK